MAEHARGRMRVQALDEMQIAVAQPGKGGAQQQNDPFGICVSNIRFSEGDAKVIIQLPKVADSAAMTGSGRILLGYRSMNNPYITAGLGGYGHAYNITQFDRIQGQRAVAFAGS